MNTHIITKRIAVIGMAGLFIYAITGPTSHAPAASPPSPAPPQNVTVINGTANPVPVVQQGTPNVNIANSAASPVPVRSVDSGATQPVQRFQEYTVPDGSSEAIESVYTVPAGKRLVLEYVSLQLILPAGQLPSLQEIATTGTGASGATGVVDVAVNGAGADSFFSGDRLVKFYVEAGGQVVLFSNRSGTTGDAFGSITISGYLVNVP